MDTHQKHINRFLTCAFIVLSVFHLSAQEVHRLSSGCVSQKESEAKAGDAQAQFQMGISYMDGIGVRQNLKKSKKWFAASAAQGYGPAEYKLAQCYTYGIGVESDVRHASSWYRRAAEKGISDAQYYYGLLCEYGMGVTKDEEKALHWIKAAEKQGHLEAAFHLGMYYYNQIEALDNYADIALLDSARQYLVKAAERNHEQALALLTRTNELEYLYANKLLVLVDSSGTNPNDDNFYPPIYLNDEMDVEEYVTDYVIYPYLAQTFGFRRTSVLLKYFVEKDGHIGHVEVLDPGLLPEFAEEAARAMLCLPLCSPGFKGNYAVRVREHILIHFWPNLY